MQPAWPERAVGALICLEFVAIMFVGLVGNPHAGNDAWFAAFFSIFPRVVLTTALPLWAVLRLVDFMFGGPARRSGFTVMPPWR